MHIHYLLYCAIFPFLGHCNPEDEILDIDQDDDQELDIASAENEVLLNKTELKKNNKKVKQHDSRSSRAHRILMNLDDKNRFTDEITV